MLLHQSALYEILSFQSPLSAFFVSKMRFLTSTTKISLVLLLILCWTFDFQEATRNFLSSLYSSRLALVINLYILSLAETQPSGAKISGHITKWKSGCDLAPITSCSPNHQKRAFIEETPTPPSLKRVATLWHFLKTQRKFGHPQLKLFFILLLILCWTFDFGGATHNFLSSLTSKRLDLLTNLTILSLVCGLLTLILKLFSGYEAILDSDSFFRIASYPLNNFQINVSRP